jgi:hypothetical protein
LYARYSAVVLILGSSVVRGFFRGSIVVSGDFLNSLRIEDRNDKVLAIEFVVVFVLVFVSFFVKLVMAV